jgi:hypothetical protein
MTDKELIALLPEYVSDRLDLAACREIESRLAQSEELRTALGAARRNTRTIDTIESKLASEKFLEKVHRRTDDKHGGIDPGLRLSHVRLPIKIAGGVTALVLAALLFNNFTGNQFFKRIFTRQESGHETGPASPASWAPFKKKITPEKRGGTTEIASGVNPVSKQMDATGQVRRDEASEVSSAGKGTGPTTTAAEAAIDKKTLRLSAGTTGQMKTTPLRGTTAARAPAVSIPSSAKKTVADKVEEQRQDENGGMDIDERIAFYEPVNANKNRKTGSGGSRSNQMKQAGKTSAVQAVNSLSAGGGKRGGVIADIIRRNGGTVDSVLEHNGDYYKVKLFLPGKKLESFQKALASKAIFASFTVAPVLPGGSTLEIIVETHAPH